jgi:hypothetical protein
MGKSLWASILLARDELRMLVGALIVIGALEALWLSTGESAEGSVDEFWPMIVLAGVITFVASAPPLCFPHISESPGWRANSILLGILWRSMILLPALGVACTKQFRAIPFCWSLVVFFFPILVLESALLIRQAKRSL